MSVQIIHGDSRAALEFMPSQSVHCIVTSPPYWGLRDYGVDGQIGLEASVAEHMAILVDLFREARRVLRDDGTLWLNYGDAYASAPNGRSAADTKSVGNDDRTFRDKPISTVGGVFKPKDRMLLPARLAIALQEDGWWVRDEIIWHKPNPMPSSVKDRTTPAHEMIYLLSKRPRYYFDQEAILEPATESTKARLAQNLAAQKGSDRANGGVRADRPMKAVARAPKYKTLDIGAALNSSTARRTEGFNDRWDNGGAERTSGMRNPRSVWTVSPKGFKEAHFATFPPDLIRPCILAGCPEGGTVLDPFFGAGTTGLVAQQHGRNCIGIELNADYIGIAKRRLGLVEHEGVFA